MKNTFLSTSTKSFNLIFTRTKLRPVANLPFYGVYRRDGEIVLKDDLLVVQKRLNYHPGHNVFFQKDRHLYMLKSNVDGKVLFSREKVEPDMSIPEVEAEYKDKVIENLYKLTVNVIPFEESNEFILKEIK
uniref:Peptidase_S24 domain-containing protein n=1 Tax=Parastrongyloides trichosuri TaxID=131310 RepID=A0A0N5A540_PARTI